MEPPVSEPPAASQKSLKPETLRRRKRTAVLVTAGQAAGRTEAWGAGRSQGMITRGAFPL
eukprot:scaffold2456_cov238-Pinguiococcus_pyrenoidosus.AAC.3